MRPHGFNPRTRESATYLAAVKKLEEMVSIHALVRVRHRVGGIAVQGDGFNPRTRESATHDLPLPSSNADVSIHALVRVRPPES